MTFKLLIIGWLTSLLARVFLFGGGGEVGAYVSVVIFWVITATLVGLTVWRLARKSEGNTLPLALLLTALALFVYRIFVTDGVTATISAMLFLACVVSLLLVYVRRKVSRRAGQQSTV